MNVEQDIEQRFAHLERSHRRLKTGLLSLTIAITTVLIVGQAKPNKAPEVIRAKSFEIVNDKKQVLLKMDAPRGRQGRLGIFNVDGRMVVGLSTTDKGVGGISTFNGKGKAMVSLGASGDGKGIVTTFNDKQQKLVRLGSSPDGEGAVVAFDDKGQMIVLVGGIMKGVGGVMTFDGDGQITGSIGVD